MVEFFMLLPFSSGPVHDLGMLAVLLYALGVYGVWRVAKARQHPMMGLLMAFTAVIGITGWGFLFAFGWALGGARKA